MCSDIPNMPKEANKAKCFVISCFVLCAALPRALIPVSPRLSRAQMHQHSINTRLATHLPVCVCASSVFSMMGFAYGPPGVVGGLCGILACIGSSILMCCAPTRGEEGNGKFTAVRMRAHAACSTDDSDHSSIPNPNPITLTLTLTLSLC